MDLAFLLSIAKGFFALLPLIIETVQAIEKAIPASGAGAHKLDAVLSVVQAAAAVAVPGMPPVAGKDQATAIEDTRAALAGPLTHIINSVVTLLNVTGAFQKSGVVQELTSNPLTGAPAPAGTD